MAVESRRPFSIGQARSRRQRLGQYLRIDDSRYLLAALALLCLMSMLYLGQTGTVATRGYELTQLRAEETLLLREQAQLRTRLAQAQDLAEITRRAEQELGLRPFTKEQVRYIVVSPAAPAQSP
jgi:hypothetical protein